MALFTARTERQCSRLYNILHNCIQQRYPQHVTLSCPSVCIFSCCFRKKVGRTWCQGSSSRSAYGTIRAAQENHNYLGASFFYKTDIISSTWSECVRWSRGVGDGNSLARIFKFSFGMNRRWGLGRETWGKNEQLQARVMKHVCVVLLSYLSKIW